MKDILYDLNEEKLNILKEVLDISLKIKDEAEKASREESEADASIENIVSLIDFREELVEKINNIGLSIRHYAAERRSSGREITEDKITAEIKTVLDGIKAADEANAQKISAIMEIIKAKIKAVKDNRALMDRYVGDNEMPSSGTLLSEKK